MVLSGMSSTTIHPYGTSLHLSMGESVFSMKDIVLVSFIRPGIISNFFGIGVEV